MIRVLALDPGNERSAYVLLDASDRRPLEIGILPNDELLTMLLEWSEAIEYVAIEMIASYGMAVGREVFETCVWIGRFYSVFDFMSSIVPVLVYRREVKLNLCESAQAKDTNVTQALIDRFAHNVRNKGKGTKTEPGWFYGFHDDIWQAYAVGVTFADQLAAATADEP